jgi:Lar family restriction alleviation protein
MKIFSDCPFCGATEKDFYIVDYDGNTRIKCVECGAVGPEAHGGVSILITAWNRRDD